jgi:predicted secreted hydrolase
MAVKKFKPIKFPQDEQAHKSVIEWWYFNGHLLGDDGKKYAFMDCFFKADSKKVKIPFLKSLPITNVYFAHHILSDIKNQKSYKKIDPLCLISKDSFKKNLLFINYTAPVLTGEYFNSEIIESAPFKYKIKTENFNLKFSSKKPPLLEGGDGFVEVLDKKTYYYSLTSLDTRGEIKIGNKIIKVKGRSWFDHQWSDAFYSQDKWIWFSLQLKNNTEIVCFQYGDEKNHIRLASIMFPAGNAIHTSKIDLINLKNIWVSSDTKTKYPLSWQIRIPQFGADFKVEPLIKNQEMIFGFINYWEGPLKVSGIFQGKKISGQGFLELVGYSLGVDKIKIVESEILGKIKKLI